ncbi:MAG: hypothetical protein R3E14_10620 [Erythrobacter sp.]
MIRKIGFGLGLAAALALTLLFAFSRTEEGKWIGALVGLYGGIIIGGAVAHDTVPGQVIDFNRPDPPTSYSAGSIRFTYQDEDGKTHEEFRRVMHSTAKFRDVEIGDPIDVWVCRNDRSVVKLVGYGTYEPGKCNDGSAPRS